ncbi:MAG: hypothetical protein OXT67_12730 [Zetaproteobacteria bacterium]|nr:hypothetical protein [Zetaproteobacteria bacterium]
MSICYLSSKLWNFSRGLCCAAFVLMTALPQVQAFQAPTSLAPAWARHRAGVPTTAPVPARTVTVNAPTKAVLEPLVAAGGLFIGSHLLSKTNEARRFHKFAEYDRQAVRQDLLFAALIAVGGGSALTLADIPFGIGLGISAVSLGIFGNAFMALNEKAIYQDDHSFQARLVLEVMDRMLADKGTPHEGHSEFARFVRVLGARKLTQFLEAVVHKHGCFPENAAVNLNKSHILAFADGFRVSLINARGEVFYQRKFSELTEACKFYLWFSLQYIHKLNLVDWEK